MTPILAGISTVLIESNVDRANRESTKSQKVPEKLNPFGAVNFK